MCCVDAEIFTMISNHRIYIKLVLMYIIKGAYYNCTIKMVLPIAHHLSPLLWGLINPPIILVAPKMEGLDCVLSVALVFSCYCSPGHYQNIKNKVKSIK